MAGHARYTALLDACVLYPIVIADALLSLATAGFFAAKWTTKIETEWIVALERNRPDLVGKLGFRRDQMREAIPDWEISCDAWQPLVKGIELPDPDDVHVVAAAIAGHADCIVTSNVGDFPNEVLDRHQIEVIDPDIFIQNQWDLNPVGAVAAFRLMRARRKRPESTPEEFASVIENAGLPATSQRVREAAALL